MRGQSTVTPESDAQGGPSNAARRGGSRYRERLILGFGLFFLFFVFYMGTAIINTPNFRNVAAIPVMSMPLGMFLSLAVFPFSWVLIIIYFIRWR